MKMAAVGLGKAEAARELHALGASGLARAIHPVAMQVIRHARVALGVAIVENERDEVAAIEVVPAAAIPEREPALLALARRLMPRLPTDDVDLLIVDRMGKDLSGTGLDTNVVGRMRVLGQPEPGRPRVKAIAVRELSPGSCGNAHGVGLADVVTRRLADAIDWPATYANARASTFLERAKLPYVAETDAEAVAVALSTLGPVAPDRLRAVRIASTLRVSPALVSPAVMADLEREGGWERAAPLKGEDRWLGPLERPLQGACGGRQTLRLKEGHGRDATMTPGHQGIPW
jgi:hypothetical protein